MVEPEVQDEAAEAQDSPKPDYTKLPNYEQIKHFEEPLTDEDFL